MRRKNRKSPLSLALAAGVIMSVSGAAFAQDVPGTALNNTEKNKVRKALNLLEAAWDDCGILGNTLNGQFNPNTQSGQANQIGYEDGATKTLKQAIDELRQMLDQDRIRKEDLGNDYGYTRPAPGTKKDYIVVNSRDFQKICKTGGFAGISDTCSAAAAVCLGATMANELVHVFQIFDGTDLKQCDAERDSDCSHLKYFEQVLKALENDMSGNPHTTPAQVGADGKTGAVLKKCLDNAGVNTAQEIDDLADKIESQRKADADRKQKTFEDNIVAGTSWGKDYYGSGWTTPIKFPRRILPANDGVELDTFDDTITDQFFVPPGNVVNQSMVFETPGGVLALVVVSHDPLDNLFVDLYLDQNMDGLPEQPAVAQTNFPPSGGGAVGLNDADVMIYPGLPVPLATGGINSGVMFLDTIRGEFYGWELDPLGFPVNPNPFLIASDPFFTPGGGAFWYLNSYWAPFPNDLQFIFSDVPNVMQFGQVDAITLGIPGGLIPAPPILPPDPLGQAVIPDFSPPGLHGLELQLQSVVLSGNPGQPLIMDSVGTGIPIPIANGVPGPDGNAPPQAPLNPINGNDLYMVTDGLDRTIYFLPEIGQAIDCALNDEDNDTGTDRLDLTSEPPRLHYSAGGPGTPADDPLKQHIYELVLEDPGADLRYTGISNWDNVSRDLLLLSGDDLPMLLLPGSNPPLYVQNLQDLDGDTNNEEAVIIRRENPQPDFFIEVIHQIPLAPFPVQQIPLPNGFQPGPWLYAELDGINGVDLFVPDLDGVQDQCFANDGTGFLFPIPCPPPPCSPADITTQGAGAGQPGFGIPDGQVTAADLNFFVNAWVAQDASIADVTTTGAGPGDPGFGVPDGQVTATDLNFYVNLFILGCP